MINLEIEILSADSKDYVYDLRNYLSERMENLEVSIKEQPGVEGEMSAFSAETLINGIIHAGVGIGIERCVHILWPLLSDWLKTVKILPGKKIEVLATLGDGSSSVMIAEDTQGNSKRYDNVTYSIDTKHTRAILIGCGEFESDFSPISPVKGNVEDLYRLLTDKRNIGLPPENITVSVNKTNAEIEEVLLNNSQLPDTETLLIYFSGHGYRSDVKKLHLIARNTRKVNDYILNGIDYDFIKNGILRASPAKQKIVILDACHSGIATQGNDDAILDIQVTGSYVLASSQSDEVSYFDKNKRNTFFTGVLLDTLRNGIDNSREMLSLNDLYESSKKVLDQKQQPHFKDKLTISPADFYFARNPAFSMEKNIRRARQLFQEGKLMDAYTECRKILKSMPDNTEIKELAQRCNSELLFTQFVKEGDELYYHNKDYKKAFEQYRRAYDIRPDFSVAEKMNHCRERISSSSDTPVVLPHLDVHTSTDDLETMDHGTKHKKEIPKNVLGLIITGSIMGIAALFLFFFFHEKKEKYTISQLDEMLLADPLTAFTNLRKSKKKDSANYVIGNYYRNEKKYDSAAFYYNKAIDAANFVPAYISLAGLYSSNNLWDSADQNSYAVLKKADSLMVADTTIYLKLGNIKRSQGILDVRIYGIDASGSFDEAERFYMKGYNKGSKECGEALAFVYLLFKRDPTRAFPYMKKAAENNSTRAQVYLSDMYARGNGTGVNKQESDRWYMSFIRNASSAELVDMAEQHYLPQEKNYTGDYVFEKDCKKAEELIKAADVEVAGVTDPIEKGTIYARIGKFYYNRFQTCNTNKSEDEQLANKYFNKAGGYAEWLVEMYKVSARKSPL